MRPACTSGDILTENLRRVSSCTLQAMPRPSPPDAVSAAPAFETFASSLTRTWHFFPSTDIIVDGRLYCAVAFLQPLTSISHRWIHALIDQISSLVAIHIDHCEIEYRTHHVCFTLTYFRTNIRKRITPYWSNSLHIRGSPVAEYDVCEGGPFYTQSVSKERQAASNRIASRQGHCQS